MGFDRLFLSLFYTSLLLAFVLNCSSCKKKEEIGPAPVIRFVSLQPNPAVKNTDVIKILIEYTDGDGDLGENTPDKKNLFVTDMRNEITYAYRISQLAPTTGIIIRGNLQVHLPPQGMMNDANSTETVTYRIYLVDRAGNRSNELVTPALTLRQ
ncbi:MAG: hypothetical protein NZM35_11690 [Chitinophagales bacterium]|nr:hypothetical protein [Chitinophagales bacterium]